MPTYNEVREALLKVIDDEWTATEFYFDNEIQNKPTNREWLHFRVRNLHSEQTSLGKPGNRRYTHYGIVRAELWGPTNEGMKTLELRADELKDLFEGIGEFNGVRVRIYNASIRDGETDGASHSMVVQFDYEFDEIK